MKKSTMVWSVLLVVLAMSFLNAQTVNVTFRVNTATVPDTITPQSAVVQVRGGTAPLTWGNDTGGQMINTGGDYWEVTLAFPPSTAISYKFFANATGIGQDTDGWEADLAGGNRSLTTSTNDTILPVKFFNSKNGSGEDDLPYTPSDSMDVWFRVNVQRLIQDGNFSPASQVLGVRGGTPALDWGNTAVLSPETPHEGNQFGYPPDLFWSGAVKIDASGLTPGTDTIFYKFVIGDAPAGNDNVAWEEDIIGVTGNRKIPITPDKPDTSLFWKWWENEAPLVAAGEDTVKVKFTTDLTRAISENGFSPGDTVIVKIGMNGSAMPNDVQLIRTNPLLFIYEADTIVFNVEAGADLQYLYYHIVNTAQVRENYYDFDFEGSGSDAETRKLSIPSPAPDTNTVLTVLDTVANSLTDANRQPQFPNSQLLPNDVLVYWECDLRPPYYHLKFGFDSLLDEQGDEDYAAGDEDQILADGVWINGPAVGGGWIGWGADLRAAADNKMWDDGTNGGDVTAGDTTYTTSWFYSGPDSSDRIGVVYKFGINGGDQEPGQGGFGLNHLINIVSNPQKEVDTVTIRTAFGSVNPNFYVIWDFNADTLNWELTAIDDEIAQIIKTIKLEQNYPNPFNPSTAITFELPRAQVAELVIYNSLGQEVATVLSGKQRQGTHVVYWNGLNKLGQPVASGLYFYRLTTDTFTKTRKMLLIR
jgi:hypothetical protein